MDDVLRSVGLQVVEVWPRHNDAHEIATMTVGNEERIILHKRNGLMYQTADQFSKTMESRGE